MKDSLKWGAAMAVAVLLVALICGLFLPASTPASSVSKTSVNAPSGQAGAATNPASMPSTTVAASNSKATAAPAPIALPTPASVLTAKIVLQDSGQDRSFTIALDEVVRKLPSGIEESIPLTPQADVAGLRETLNKMRGQMSGELYPVAYEDGVDRSLQTRRLVTPKIRVELKSGEDLTNAIPGAVEIARPDYAPGFVVVKMPDSFAALDVLAMVRASGGVERADVLLAKQQSRRTLPNDTLIASQWHLKNTGQSGGAAGIDVNVEPVWNYGGTGFRGAGVVVGVVDDGLQTAHPDLAANIRTPSINHDWNDSTPNDPNPPTGDGVDGNNHGTCCAGNVAAIGNNSLGVSGTAPEAKLVGLRLIAASEPDDIEAAAMTYDNDLIQIKSNSWGPNDDGKTLEAPGSLTKAALQSSTTSGRGGLGTVFLWACGNGGDVGDDSNYDGYANSIYTIAIGAFSNKSTRIAYSEPGANVIVVAPSGGDPSAGELNITTVDRTGTDGYNPGSTSGELSDANYTKTFNGTSSATPTAAGVVALILQRNPNLGWRDVKEILIRSARKVNSTDTDWTTNSAGFHFNHKFGAGLIDANAAVALAATWTNLGAQTSAVSTQSGLSVAIPNNNATGITRTFDLGSSNIRAEQVTVRLNINHTARGNLAITLTSPTGVVSRLAEVHSDTANANYANWTFMTVRDWGESSAGTWTLKIADRSSTGNSAGGTLTAAELTVFGAAAAPTNPAPVVQLTSPQDQGSYSIGTAINLAATASDLALGGGPGAVAKVEFLAAGSVVGTDTSAPYSVNWTPPTAGTYTLSARATDSEGAVGTSSSVAITVANQPPTVTAASVFPASPVYVDQALSLTGVVASDPEGVAVTLTYQWQSSTDGVTFANVAGQTAATVPPVLTNAGKSWRCVLTPSDGPNTGAPFTTAALMVLTRPAASVTTGTSYSYTSDLVLRGTTASFTRAAIINEFSQGISGANVPTEWVEILTLQTGSFRKWKFDDASVDTSLVTFADSTVWDNIPAGTRVVIYNGAAKDAQLPADDTDLSDGKLVISSSNATYFSGSSWPALGNSGDALILKNSASNVVHQISYGNNTTVTPNIGAVAGGRAAAFTGDTEAAAATVAGWRSNSSTTAGSTTTAGVTPGEGNTTANATFAANLRSGFFNQPALFRFGASSQTPAGLSISAAGVLSGTVTAAAGDYVIVIEKYNGASEVASHTFTLSVLSPGATPVSTPTPPPAATPSPPTAPPGTGGTTPGATSPKITIIKKAVVSNGNALLIRGRTTGVGLITVRAKIKKTTRTLTTLASMTYTFRLKLQPGRNVVTLQSMDAEGSVSDPIRVAVTKR